MMSIKIYIYISKNNIDKYFIVFFFQELEIVFIESRLELHDSSPGS